MVALKVIVLVHGHNAEDLLAALKDKKTRTIACLEIQGSDKKKRDKKKHQQVHWRILALMCVLTSVGNIGCKHAAHFGAKVLQNGRQTVLQEKECGMQNLT